MKSGVQFFLIENTYLIEKQVMSKFLSLCCPAAVLLSEGCFMSLIFYKWVLGRLTGALKQSQKNCPISTLTAIADSASDRMV